MSARISKMYKDSGGCKVGKTCGECRYYANSGIKNEYVCKRQVSDDLWDGKWSACKFFEDRGDEPMELIKTDEITIDPEFSKLIKPLDEEEYKQLEENCVKYGIQDTIKTWNNIIVDGHNRYAIAKKHNLPCKTEPMTFSDKEEVKYWIRNNQLGRRNLENWEKFDLDKENKAYEAKLAEKNLHLSKGRGVKKEVVSEKPTEILREVKTEPGQTPQKPESAQEAKKPDRHAGETSAKMGKRIGVSARTYDKMEYIDKHGTPEINKLVRQGTISTERAYQDTKARMNPTPKKPTPLAEHKEYEKKKEENTGTVDFKSAKEDKANLKLIYMDFWTRFGSIRNSINKLKNDSEVGHLDLGEAKKYLDERQFKELRSSINESINLLSKFAKEINE